MCCVLRVEWDVEDSERNFLAVLAPRRGKRRVQACSNCSIAFIHAPPNPKRKQNQLTTAVCVSPKSPVIGFDRVGVPLLTWLEPTANCKRVESEASSRLSHIRCPRWMLRTVISSKLHRKPGRTCETGRTGASIACQGSWNKLSQSRTETKNAENLSCC